MLLHLMDTCYELVWLCPVHLQNHLHDVVHIDLLPLLSLDRLVSVGQVLESHAHHLGSRRIDSLFLFGHIHGQILVEPGNKVESEIIW